MLNLKEGASVDEVKSAYRKRAFELHPDLHPERSDAARQFQLLNEAYVLLTRNVDSEDGTRAQAQSAYEKAKRGFDAAQAEQDRKAEQEQKARASEAYNRTKAQQAPGAPGRGSARKTSARQQVRQEDVLNDILKDPFARRVFEDIYSQVRRDSGKAVAAPKKRKLNFEWGDSKLTFDMTHGLASGVKGWMRKQMDDEQTIYMPPQNLVPGTKVRISLSQGMNGDPRQIEITLPQDFVVGRPIRLKGLGRKIGPWTGDLYLRVLARI